MDDRTKKLEDGLRLLGFEGEVTTHEDGKYQFKGMCYGYEICTNRFPTIEEVALDATATLIDEARLSERYTFVKTKT